MEAKNLLHNAAELCLCQMSLFLGGFPSIEDTDQPVHQFGMILAMSITSLDKLGQGWLNPVVPSPGQGNFLAREVKLEWKFMQISLRTSHYKGMLSSDKCSEKILISPATPVEATVGLQRPQSDCTNVLAELSLWRPLILKWQVFSQYSYKGTLYVTEKPDLALFLRTCLY